MTMGPAVEGSRPTPILPAAEGPEETRSALTVFLRLLAVVSALIGIAVAALTVWIGDCSAFGGTCPRERGSLLEDDVFGSLVMCGLLIAGAPYWLLRPTLMRFGKGFVIGIGFGILLGLMGRSMVSG